MENRQTAETLQIIHTIKIFYSKRISKSQLFR